MWRKERAGCRLPHKGGCAIATDARPIRCAPEMEPGQRSASPRRNPTAPAPCSNRKRRHSGRDCLRRRRMLEWPGFGRGRFAFGSDASAECRRLRKRRRFVPVEIHGAHSQRHARQGKESGQSPASHFDSLLPVGPGLFEHFRLLFDRTMLELRRYREGTGVRHPTRR